MQSFLINNKPIPLASFKFLNTKTLVEAEQALATTVEPRHLSTQSKSGEQGVRVTRYQLADIQLYGLQFDSPLSISSEQLQSVNILFPISGTLRTPTTRGDAQVTSGYAKIDSPGGRVEVEWDTCSTSMVTRIPIDTLTRHCQQLYEIDISKGIRFESVIDLARYPGASLHNLLATIVLEAENTGSLLNKGVSARQFQELLITALLHGQPHSFSDEIRRGVHTIRAFYIKRATEYIHENIQEVITLADLVNASGVSLRTLQAGFSRHYNMGQAREELIAANHLTTTVAEIAAKWGFYNPCSFASNYKKQFGESPSATLQQ